MHKNKHNKQNTTVKAMQQIELGPLIPQVYIPTEITVHLGRPVDNAENVTVPYLDYIKNVASSELYPTWPEGALRANIYAITSFALNRVYTNWYKSRGYDFDITNSTQYDQAYVHNRGIFDTISSVANEIFHHYIVREGQYQPLFSQFCDGRITVCDGLHQWGTVDLALQGNEPFEILQYYYGDNIRIVTDAPIANIAYTFPSENLKLGDSSRNVLRMQFSLDRISDNYPGIPRIPSIDGYFGEDTKRTVMEFQRVFNLPVTGIIDEGTWYGIIRIFSAVARLAELTSEGLLVSEVQEIASGMLLEGDVRPSVSIVQYGLNLLSAYYATIPGIAITGIFDDATRNAVIQFQKTMNIPQTGVADLETLELLYRTATGILDTLPAESVYLPQLRWPGVVYNLGHESPGVYIIQEMLSYISLVIPTIQYIEPNGTYDERTQEAVIAFQNMQGLKPDGIVNEETWLAIVNVYIRQRYGGALPQGALPTS